MKASLATLTRLAPAALAFVALAACSTPSQDGDAADSPTAADTTSTDATTDIAADTVVSDTPLDVSVDVAMDIASDASRSCGSATDCPTGEICVFGAAGCGGRGVCRTDIRCGPPSRAYCGCDGVTFYDHCAGPPAPWVTMDACPDAAVTVDARTDAQPTDAPVLRDSGGGPCGSGGLVCGAGLTCCSGACINFANDPLNCGGCGTRCTGTTPMCAGGTCTHDMCSPVCGTGSVCCAVNGGGPVRPPVCYVGITCPVGCPTCL